MERRFAEGGLLGLPQRIWEDVGTQGASLYLPELLSGSAGRFSLAQHLKGGRGWGRDLTRLSSYSATPAVCISGTRVSFGYICARNTELLPTPKCTTTF